MSDRHATNTGARKQANVDVELLTPRCREAWEHRLAGKSTQETAKAMDCTRQNVWQLWALSMKSGTSEYQAKHPKSKEYLRLTAKDKELTSAGRCKCGLLMPCLSCVPTIYELASSRRDGGMMSVTTASSVSGNASSGAR